TEPPRASAPSPSADDLARSASLITTVMLQTPWEAAVELEGEPDAVIAAVLAQLPAGQAQGILEHLDAGRRARVTAGMAPEVRAHWLVGTRYPEDSVGSLMAPPSGTFRPESTVAEAIETLRRGAARPEIVTYGYVTDAAGELLGVLVMRDLLLAPRDALLR